MLCLAHSWLFQNVIYSYMHNHVFYYLFNAWKYKGWCCTLKCGHKFLYKNPTGIIKMQKTMFISLNSNLTWVTSKFSDVKDYKEQKKIQSWKAISTRPWDSFYWDDRQSTNTQIIENYLWLSSYEYCKISRHFCMYMKCV